MIRILRDLNTGKRLHVIGEHEVVDYIEYGSQRVKTARDTLGRATEYETAKVADMKKTIVDSGVFPEKDEYTVEMTVVGNLAVLDNNGEPTGETTYRTETRRFVYDKIKGNSYYIDGELKPYTPDPLPKDETIKLTNIALIGYPDKVDSLINEFLYWKAAVEPDTGNNGN